jgi:predicted flap endonuclease-1-like 5' DNA nuclease
VVPVQGSCRYKLSFYGVTNDHEAQAEVLWRQAGCGLVRTDTVPIPLLAGDPPSGEQPRLSQARGQWTAPAAATQAEVRFSVPTGCAGITCVSFGATLEEVENSTLHALEGELPQGWRMEPESPSDFSLLPAEELDGGIGLANAGAETVVLAQTVPAAAGRSYSLAMTGRRVGPAAAGPGGRVELGWLGADNAPVAAPVTLGIGADGGQAAATGTVPADAVMAELRLVIPAGVSLNVNKLSLRYPQTTEVPATFIAQAPGELTVQDWIVSYDLVAPEVPAVGEDGLCTPTPPGREPGDPGHGCCPCCDCEHPLDEPEPMVTDAGRPVQVGTCAGCGSPRLSHGGRLVPGARRVPIKRLPPPPRPVTARAAPDLALFSALRPSPVAAAAPAAQPQGKAEPVPQPPPETAPLRPLTAVKGIGKKREKTLQGIGIDSVEKLAAAQPEKLARALGISEQRCSELINQAQQLLDKSKGQG